jgi:hypothetical protein
MPEVCRQYDCYWREREALPEAWRPDRIGCVVTEAGCATVGPRRLPVVLIQEDVAGTACELLDYFLGRGFAAMIIHGPEARVEFDRARWPGISADDIEAALRYELSQDAAELKRLGAVGDEYRPLGRDEAEATCREARRP